jgi:hypothetical protein
MDFSLLSGILARMILRSVSRSFRPSRSTGMNQPDSFMAWISMEVAPWVTAVEKVLAENGTCTGRSGPGSCKPPPRFALWFGQVDQIAVGGGDVAQGGRAFGFQFGRGAPGISTVRTSRDTMKKVFVRMFGRLSRLIVVGHFNAGGFAGDRVNDGHVDADPSTASISTM